ncbi:phosphate signaling complex PhoU family protein [Halococcoides cellulosivorans]|uniref:Histidine kinase n=1 Tax=Halococcoides cellulosivorans TaxID=1679096 RepID=A0A2R4WZD9_9EURY|nr:phosphate uptake regulator PhoU [Halococcoides cellulosivorans]AWB26900.1 histidine kinase [Halococcoides cellulosivorans]
METRKVQLTGGSTYTVSLPKEWATANDVEAGSEIQFYPEDERLVLSPERSDDQSTGSFDVGSRDGAAALTRVVITMYVSGFDEIRLTADRLTADQRQVIRQATQGLVGLEIIEETPERVVLQDLLDSSELEIENSLERMRLVALTMVRDAVTALVERDEGLARDVIDRDDDVDRLWFMVSRIFRTVLRNPAASTTVDLDRETVFDYQSGARQLERVADHATKIAGVARDVETVPESVVADLQALETEATDLCETAVDALLESDTEAATREAESVLERLPEVTDRARDVSNSVVEVDDSERAQRLGLVVDSLSRTADYGGNVAESAFLSATPRPE